MNFDPHCRCCQRLTKHLQRVKHKYPDYFCAPVPALGKIRAPLLIVGLAPGLHGANASGIPFTGDSSGHLLFKTLHELGYSRTATVDLNLLDGGLIDCRITNAVKCLPPENKPLLIEFKKCAPYLSTELQQLPAGGVVVALGQLAHNAILRVLGVTLSHYPFSHLGEHAVVKNWTLLDSYHCSRYNTQTKRLTPEMFKQVFDRTREILDAERLILLEPLVT